jgi:hypothetical protein
MIGTWNVFGSVSGVAQELGLKQSVNHSFGCLRVIPLRGLSAVASGLRFASSFEKLLDASCGRALLADLRLGHTAGHLRSLRECEAGRRRRRRLVASRHEKVGWRCFEAAGFTLVWSVWHLHKLKVGRVRD